jgi:8-oxo-dGTP diphosphatase
MIDEILKKQFIIVKSLVVNDEGEILFVRRKREWHKEAHDKWEFPGGKIDFCETPEAAAIREAKEESGYDVKIEYLIPKLLSSTWEREDRVSQQILICYVCKAIGGEKKLQDHGVSEIKWFKRSEVPSDKDCLPGTIDFLNLYFKATAEHGKCN